MQQCSLHFDVAMTALEVECSFAAFGGLCAPDTCYEALLTRSTAIRALNVALADLTLVWSSYLHDYNRSLSIGG